VNPERFLGSDPTPGDLAGIDEIQSVVREVVVVLAETRQRIEEAIGPDSIWQGSEVEPIVDGMSALSARLRALEEAVVAFAAAWQEWRQGVAGRQDATAELVDEMSQLAGITDADARRDDIRQRAGQLAAQHEQEAARLVVACEDLIAVVSVEHDDDIAAMLGRGFTGLREAVEVWLREASDEVRRTAGELADVAEVTAVAPQLAGVGIGAEGISSQKAWEIAKSAPASYRLQQVLRRDWSNVRAPTLQSASFAGGETQQSGRTLADRIRGITRGARSHDDD